MSEIYKIQIGQRFSFEVFPAAILGNNFQDVKLEGIISAQTAAAYGVDIVALHQNVYPSLPPGTPNDPYGYSYIRFQYPNGENQIMGVPYIRPESIRASMGGRVVMSFENQTQADLERIMLALSSNGYRPSNVQVEAQ